jgi:hypothetical protein
MATYTAKLIDHTDTQKLVIYKGGVQRILKELYDQAFAGTSDSVTVVWGTGSSADNLIIHFVLDLKHSFIREKWPAATISPDAGGHTHTEGALACSEIYQNINGIRQQVRQLAVLAFHESLHNLLPFWGMEEMHNLDGGGRAAGLAGKKVGPDAEMTARNKELIRRGFSVKNPQHL